MAIVRFVFAALKSGVDASDYERFEREVDYAVSEKLKTIVSYRTHRITEIGAWSARVGRGCSSSCPSSTAW